MQATPAPSPDLTPWAPWAPYRCPSCRRFDSIPMPAQSLLDKLIRTLCFSPYKCRACRAKYYRRAMPKGEMRPPEAEGDSVPILHLVPTPPPVAKQEPVPILTPAAIQTVRHTDHENTLRRVNNIIRQVEVKRLRVP